MLVSTVPSGFEMMGELLVELLGTFAAMEQGDIQRVTELQMRCRSMAHSPARAGKPGRAPGRGGDEPHPVANRTAITADLQPLDPLALPDATGCQSFMRQP